MAVTEELTFNLIRVDFCPDSIFKYYLIYKAEDTTGMVGVYGFDEDWYYLYKQDAERYRVKRRKDLEGIKPSFTYKQQKRCLDKQDEQTFLDNEKVKVAEAGAKNIQSDTNVDMPEQISGIKMGGM